MTTDLVPELHDVGKLAPDRFKHTFDDFDFAALGIKPDSPTWRGILEHHCADRDRYHPTGRQTFLLHLADALAATASRLPTASKVIGKSAVRLWNPSAKADPPDMAPEDLARFVETAPTATEFFSRFDTELDQRAEDAKANVTSLRTHCELVGKFYRLLEKQHTSDVPDLEFKTKAQVRQAIAGFTSRLRLTLVRCSPRFLISPFRARDVGVFSRQWRLLQTVKGRFPDNVLFSTGEDLLLALETPEVWQEVEEVFTSNGFRLDVARSTVSFSSLTREADLRDVLGPNTVIETRFPSLEPAIRPPLCEGCRMAAATLVWREGDREDDLCEVCAGIRDESTSLARLADWDGSVVWAYLALDFGQLIETLRRLYVEHIVRHGTQGPAEVRFSLIGEFQKDYDTFLHKVGQGIPSIFGSVNTERLLPSLFCVRLQSPQEIVRLLEILHDEMRVFFPKFLELDRSPLRLGLSCSAAKFPFFEHWRMLEKPPSDVFVNLVGQGRVKAPLRALPYLVRVANLPHKHALHNLAEVAKISESLARLKMHDRADAGSGTYRQLREDFLPLGLDYQSVLTLAKIVGG